jgi:hypothetical protein
MRDETITQNLTNLMKREVIKQQCWDSMAVKGRCIEVFYYYFNQLINIFLCKFRVLQIQIENKQHQLLLKIIH